MINPKVIFTIWLSYLILIDATPTALTTSKSATRNLQISLEQCVQELQPAATATAAGIVADDKSEQNAEDVSGYVRCVATNLGLWTDEHGYNPKRVAAFFAKQKMPHEIIAVTDHCNEQHRQADANKWAYAAYRCATTGRMGKWLKEYMKKNSQTYNKYNT